MMTLEMCDPYHDTKYVEENSIFIDLDSESQSDQLLLENLKTRFNTNGACAEQVQDEAVKQSLAIAKRELEQMSPLTTEDLEERNQASKHLNIVHVLKRKPRSTLIQIG